MNDRHFPKVYIVMATRNAGTFLEPQITSIKEQTYSNWTLWIRDDASKDGTADRLKEWALDDRIQIISPHHQGEGAAHAFLDALFSVPKDADYFAFCDQDDVWLPSKLEHSVKELQNLEASHPEIPCLVHSDLRVVDRSLNPIAASFFKYQGLSPAKRNNLKDLLIQNHVTGCTAVFNRKLAEQTLVGGLPTSVCMHDWWVALIAAASGKIGTIRTPLVLYRQHEGNDTGARQYSLLQEIYSFSRRPKLKIHKVAKSLDDTRRQAESLLELHGDYLSYLNYNLVKRYSEGRYRSPLNRRIEMMSLGITKSNISKTIAMYLFP